MSNITTTTTLHHAATRIKYAPSGYTRTANEDSISSGSIELLLADGEQVVPLGDLITVRNVQLALVSGDDLRIGLGGSTYPFRLTGTEAQTFRIDVEGLVETATIVAQADTNTSLSSKYLVLNDKDGSVWVWFSTGAQAVVTLTMVTQPTEGDKIVIGSRTYTWQTSLTNVDGNIWIGSNIAAAKNNLYYAIAASGGTPGTDYATAMTANTEVTVGYFNGSSQAVFTSILPGTAANSLASTATFTAGTNVFSAATLTGGVAASTAPAGSPSPTRKLQVDVVANSTDLEVAVALAAGLNADSKFTSAVPTTATVTVSDAHTGIRGDAADGNTGWAAPITTQEGAPSPVIHMKSVGTTQVVVGVAPN
jgi:hypothetical protein